jgi:hypothetical protein
VLCIGLVTYRLQRRSIRMDTNAAFAEEIYQAVKASDEFRRYFDGKKVVIVIDNVGEWGGGVLARARCSRPLAQILRLRLPYF